MKISSLVLWIVFVSYSTIYVFTFGLSSELLPNLLLGQADAFSTLFFNWMGLVPFYFLVDASLDKQRPWISWLPLLFGFFLGAYSTLWGYQHLTGNRNKLTMIKKILLLILLITSSWMLINAVFITNSTTYFSLFFQDALVGVMTIDFLILYIWSILLASSRYRLWWLSFLPMVGFGLLLLIEDNAVKPVR
jgi:hypothetical protein